MKYSIEEAGARLMGSSLTSHARDILRYARTYGNEGETSLLADDRQRLAFIHTVDGMIREMYSLLLVARRKGLARFINREQIDASMLEARQIVAKVARKHRSTVLN